MGFAFYANLRACFHRDMVVRKACTSDVPRVENLVRTLDLNENLLADLKQFNRARRDDDGTEIQCFVAQCNDQIVGAAVVRREEVSYLAGRCQYPTRRGQSSNEKRLVFP